MTFNEKIVKLRKLKGITQDELASAVGVSRQAVCKWESGQSYPEVSNLLELKLLFNISIDDLLDENYEVILPEKKKRKRISNKVKEKVERELVEATSEEPAAEPAVAEDAPEVKEEPVIEAAAAPEELAPEEKAEKEEGKRKVSLFGRLFGRK